MKIIFSRHGNTFLSSHQAVWVGCADDVPLVDSGKEQAKALARALVKSATILNAVYCGALQRTAMYANIVLHEIQSNLQPVIDCRLNELDYGKWSGLNKQQICEQFGAEELKAWERYSIWPTQGDWGSSEGMVRAEAASFMAYLVKNHQPNDTVLVVSSNGRLRYFLTVIPGEFERRAKTKSFAVKTGNISQLSYLHDQWSLDYWDMIPSERSRSFAAS